MADYTVSGAGTTAVNGDYTANGTHNSQPKYEHSSGDYWLYYEDFEMEMSSGWCIDSSVTDQVMSVDALYSTGTNITGKWYQGMGASPAPSVAAASSGTTHSIAGVGTSSGTATCDMTVVEPHTPTTYSITGIGDVNTNATCSVSIASEEIVYVDNTVIYIGTDGANFFDGKIDEVLLKANVMIEDDQPVFTSTGWLNDVIFWPFFENTGTTVHGTNILMPTLELHGGTWAVGRNNYAAQFDGVSQYASSAVTAETFSNNKLSVCVAIRFDADAACQIISQVDGINMEYTGTHIRANITGVTEGTTDIAKLDVNTTDWYFISVQYDGSYKTCYVNGQKIGEVAATGTPVMSDSTMNIATNGAKTEFGACTIDFVRIYRNTLFPYVRPIQYMCAGQTGALGDEEWVVK